MKKTLGVAEYTASTKIQVLPPAEHYIFLLDEGYISAVKKREEVVKGDVIATNKNKKLFSPCNGIVDVASEKEIKIISQSEVTKESLTPTNISSLSVEEQIAYFEANGITSLWKNSKAVQVCFINALPTDAVKVQYMPFLLAEERSVIEKGIEVLQHIYPSARIHMVVPQGYEYTLRGVESIPYAKAYPYTLTPLVKNALQGEDALGVMALSLMDIWHIGSIALSQMPLAETILTVNDNVVKLPLGYPLQLLLEHLSIPLQNVDGAVLNGVMHGIPLCSLHGGILPSMYSLHTFTASEIPPVTENPCVSCGYCTQICPVGLRVHILNQYAQKTMFEACEDEHIEACIECGMCDYICITKRPIMQYIRNAKQHTKRLLPMG